MNTKKTDSIKSNNFSRKDFLKTSAFVGGCAALASQYPWLTSFFNKAKAEGLNGASFPEYKLALPENVIYSTCLQCHAGCQIKAKMWDGVLSKISGSPYSPQNMLPHLPMTTGLDHAAKSDGKLCAKGQSGVQTYADPYRLRKVIKRDGPRGSNKWKTIPFDQFLDEVSKGGKLFADIGEDREYPGFEEVYALRDSNLSKRMASDAQKVGKGEMKLSSFKQKYRDHLDVLIDPEHPDLGPKNNQFTFQAGRIEHGRKEMMKWFTEKSLGSPNHYEHTTICEQSHHIAYDEVTGGDNHHMKPDLQNTEFVLFWGTGAFTANFGLTPMAEKVTTGKVDGRMKTAVVDPRLSNDAGKADWWLPVKPGEDLALAMAMIRWIIENRRFDQRYLENANNASANMDGEPTWSNATHLVKIVDGQPRELLKASELNMGSNEENIVSHNGSLAAVNPGDKNHPVRGDLYADTTVNGTPVKSVFQILKDEAFSKSMDEYAEQTGVKKKTIIEVARELTSHGKRAVVEMYRGPVQHTNGFYAGMAIITLNVLLGNADYKGGLIKGGGHWHEFGGKPGNVYHFDDFHPAPLTAFGPKNSREGDRYEDYSLFREQGYPAKRPWYPFTSNVYQEIIPSFANGYPYPGKILFLHKGTPALASPAGHKQIEMLKSQDKIPLFIACDIVIGETSMYADYIVPDLTYLERWATTHVTPDVPTLTSKIRQPAGVPLTEEVEVDGETMPISMEAFLIGLGKKLDLPGFGKDALGSGFSFDRPEDWYLKLVANIAYGDKKGEMVPDADQSEFDVFRNARRHLPESVFDENKWKKALRPEEWSKVVYILNRGGRFDDFKNAYDGKFMAYHTFGGMFQLFVNNVATQKNSMSGQYFDGYPVQKSQYDCTGNPLERDGKYPLRLITFKHPWGGQSRTTSNYCGQTRLLPENFIWMNRITAEQYGFRDNDLARIVSPSNPDGTLALLDGEDRTLEMVGKVSVREGIRPDTVAVSWHYGNWAYGSNDVEVDGNSIKGDKNRAKGLCPNPSMEVDPVLKDVTLSDPVGGSASFFDTHVNLVNV